MRNRFLVFGSPLIEQPEIDEVVRSLKSGWIGTGPKVNLLYFLRRISYFVVFMFQALTPLLT